MCSSIGTVKQPLVSICSTCLRTEKCLCLVASTGGPRARIGIFTLLGLLLLIMAMDRAV
jgi:MYXO-CTERM domain-containing protein